jgi:hypothetical protein
MDLGNLTPLQMIGLGVAAVVGLIVAAAVLRILVKISRVLFAVGCLVVLAAFGGCFWMVFMR